MTSQKFTIMSPRAVIVKLGSGQGCQGLRETKINDGGRFLLAVVILYVRINLLKPTGHLMHQQFNIQQLYVLLTRFIYLFCVDLRANSDYFPIQH